MSPPAALNATRAAAAAAAAPTGRYIPLRPKVSRAGGPCPAAEGNAAEGLPPIFGGGGGASLTRRAALLGGMGAAGALLLPLRPALADIGGGNSALEQTGSIFRKADSFLDPRLQTNETVEVRRYVGGGAAPRPAKDGEPIPLVQGSRKGYFIVAGILMSSFLVGQVFLPQWMVGELKKAAKEQEGAEGEGGADVMAEKGGDGSAKDGQDRPAPNGFGPKP